MYDLDTIKRLNRNPSKREEQRKPAPQPRRSESIDYAIRARIALDWRSREAQPPAADTRSGHYE